MRVFLVFCSMLFFAFPALGAVSISTSPQVDQIRPDLDLVDTQVRVTPNSEYEIIVRTPESHPLISTDFPIVEGTQLYHLRGFTKDGIIRFKTIYPIRGTYKISVLTGGTWEYLELDINETPGEIINLLIFSGFLLLLGLLGGYLLQKTAKAEGEAQKLNLTASVILLALLAGSFSGEVQAHSAAHDIEQKGFLQWSASEGDHTFSVQFDSNQAIVGESVTFHMQLVSEQKIIQEPFTVKMETFHMEDKTVMFEGSFTSSKATEESCGLCSISTVVQFFDGAETKLTFTTTLPNGKQLSVDGVIGVEGRSPPTAVKIKTLLLLAGLILTGVALGFFFIPTKKRTAANAV
ncbi:MAG: hypothetical protein COB67_11240 [SAR324 cluster bacterium]|uniref:Uncharacterized protein n=1 Tax=SAR324 cluster bacterium TaxID=2024889 RepID=A0A2A4SVZ8_9DELT|nr:MAG: hypothetical protein COB67_11240 [SAR324 cluster bacterium]